ncbi:MAG: hypothetical protein NTY22_08005 [Proteobacteria bacterium]|nr:hypothetical protein [Pseudomonadota bacterium]
MGKTNTKKGCFMKGRTFITIIGLAVMLFSVNAMADEVKPEIKPSVSTTPTGQTLNFPVNLGLIDIAGTKLKLTPDNGTNGNDSSTKIGIIKCKYVTPSIVSLANIAKDIVGMSLYTKIARDNIASRTSIMNTYNTGMFNSTQLLISGALANPYFAPAIFSSIFGGGSNSYGNSYGYGYGSYYGSTGNISSTAASIGASNARWH